jgi:hypothetical protein
MRSHSVLGRSSMAEQDSDEPLALDESYQPRFATRAQDFQFVAVVVPQYGYMSRN